MVEHIIVCVLTPPSATRKGDVAVGSPSFPDYPRIFADLNLESLMRWQRVREIWHAQSGLDRSYPSYRSGVHNPADFRVSFASNMSSPATGDISNSFRWSDDLPVLSHTYVAYGINFRRSQAEAVHNVGHQLEAMMSHVSHRQTGHDRLFCDFAGQNAQGQFVTGRAGWTHMPPNTIGNYDCLNRTLIPSDIEDWRPDNAGQKKAANVDTWGTLKNLWPGDADFPQRVEKCGIRTGSRTSPGAATAFRTTATG